MSVHLHLPIDQLVEQPVSGAGAAAVFQAKLWNPGEIVFCWAMSGKSPQRTWTMKADGSGLRPLYQEAPCEWATHEAVISKDEVTMAIMGHRAIPGQDDGRARPARRCRKPWLKRPAKQ